MKALERIDKLVGRINTHPEYSIEVAMQKRDTLRKEAQRHSAEIEFEMVMNGNGIKKGGIVEMGILGRLDQAWNYLAEHGIDVHSLGRLGNIIDSDRNPNSVFRRGDEISIGRFDAPKAAEIPQMIEGLVDYLKMSNLHPVVRAAEAHLSMVQIHPYADGNGRSARILQNLCLEQRGYPSAVISSNERGLYFGLVDASLEKRYNRDTSPLSPGHEDKLFYEFIASKVLTSVQTLDEHLAERRAYEITLGRGDINHGLLYAIDKRVKGVSKIVGKGIHVRIIKGKRKLIVIGDIAQDELAKRVDHAVAPHNIKYKIKVMGR